MRRFASGSNATGLARQSEPWRAFSTRASVPRPAAAASISPLSSSRSSRHTKSPRMSSLLSSASSSVPPAMGMTSGGPAAQRRFQGNYSRKTIAGSYWPENPEKPGREDIDNLEQPTRGVVIKPNTTLVDIWNQAVQAFPMRRFMATKMWVRGRLGYVWASYEAMQKEVDALRHLLAVMGVAKGGRVAIISENRYEWFVVQQAVLQLGAQLVVLPTNVTPSEARKIVKNVGCRVMLVESEASYAAIKDWVGEVGDLKHALCFEDRETDASYAVALAIAEDVLEKTPQCETISNEDSAMIMFTAGTTGAPKGVLLSHKTLVANISSIFSQLGESVTHEDVFMSLCPWTVAGALAVEIYQVVAKGAMIILPPEMIEGFQDIPEVHPSVVCSVALPFQRAYNNIIDEILSRNKISREATRIAIGAITESRVMMRKPNGMMRTVSELALGKFKAQFGNDLRVVIILGHMLTKDQIELLADLDLFVVNTYGCMEAGGVLATDMDVPGRLKALPGVELRVVNENNEVVVPGDLGEVLVEAPHCMQGYFDINIDQDEIRNSVVCYGSRTFVRTGDYGLLTGQWITIRGHKDVLITLDDGKVLDPLEIETILTKSPFIKQAFVFGDRRGYVTALIVPLSLSISNHLQKVERRDGVPVVSEREKAECVRAELRRVSTKLPARAHVRRFAFVDEFTHANGFMTNKWGYARQKVEAHYVHYINQLYDDGPKFYGYAVDDYDDLF